MKQVLTKAEKEAFAKVMNELKYNAKTYSDLISLKNVADLYKELYPYK